MKRSLSETVKKVGVFRIALMILAGIVLILCSVPLSETGTKPTALDEAGSAENTGETAGYEERLEERLQAILEQVDGIQSVDVMITLSAGSRKIVDKDETLQKEEESDASADGSSQTRRTENSESTTVLTEQSDNSRVPYVLQEMPPQIQGVLIVARGDMTPSKLEQISSAVQALFQIEAHKIKVLEKKS